MLYSDLFLLFFSYFILQTGSKETTTDSNSPCPSGFTLLNDAERKPVECLTDLCPIGSSCHFSPQVDTFLCCQMPNVDDNNPCSEGWTMLYQSGLPKQCLLYPCPEGYRCQYSIKLHNYVCCGPLSSNPKNNSRNIG